MLKYFKSKGDNFILLSLLCSNLILLLIFILFLLPKKYGFPKINPISADTPVVRFSLISPQEGSTVAGRVPLITTISNGPKIVKSTLEVDGKQTQSVFAQETEKLVVFWDTIQSSNGAHTITITAVDDQKSVSQLYSRFTVENK